MNPANFFNRSLFAILIILKSISSSWSQVPFNMAEGDYFESFQDIQNWGQGFVSGTGASCWASVPIQTTGTIPDGKRTSRSSEQWVSGTTGGIQKGVQSLVFLSTGTTSLANAVAADLLLNFSGRMAGTLAFDWAAIDNGGGSRPASLRVYWSIDGLAYFELAGCQIMDQISSSAGSIQGIALPAALHNVPTVHVRFYQHTGTTGGSGNRDKIQIDNIQVTSGPLGYSTPSVSALPANPVGSSFMTLNGNISGDGGSPIIQKGFCYKTAPGPTLNDQISLLTGSDTGIISQSISVDPETKYYFKAFATNLAGTTLSDEFQAFSLSEEPLSYPAIFSAEPDGYGQISLMFPGPESLGADGYLLIGHPNQPTAILPSDGHHVDHNILSGEGSFEIWVPAGQNQTNVVNLQPTVPYYFSLFPFQWNGTDTATLNYRTGGAYPQANAITPGIVDSTTQISGPALQDQPASGPISALTTLPAQAIRVFDFRISDAGDSDNLPTIPSQLILKGGPFNTASWSGTLGGIRLSVDAGMTFLETSQVILDTASLTIAIPVSGFSIPDSSTILVSLYIYLEGHNLTDQGLLQFRIDSLPHSHGWATHAGSSGFSNGFPNAPVSQVFTIDVQATELQFLQQPTLAGTFSPVTPEVLIQAVDANGNRDLGFEEEVFLHGSEGLIISQTAQNGLASFQDLVFVMANPQEMLTATSGTLSGISQAFPVIFQPGQGHILINQLNPGFNLASSEYIELVNTTSQAFDLSVLKVMYSSAGGSHPTTLGTLSGTIPPHGYWLLSTEPSVTSTQGTPVSRDGSFSAGMAATGGQVALMTLTGLKVDGIGYGMVSPNILGEGSPCPSPPNQTDGLRRETEAGDTDDNSLDFISIPFQNLSVRNHSSRCILEDYILINDTIGADLVLSGINPHLQCEGKNRVNGNLNLTVGGASIGAGQSLSVGGNLVHSGSGILTLGSTPANQPTGALLVEGTISGTGQVTMERYLPGHNGLPTEGWRLISSPALNPSISTNTSFSPGLNDDFFAFDEQANAWLNQKLSANNIDHLVPGSGYLVAFENAGMHFIQGTPNQASLVFENLSCTGGGGWHLVGNPYPTDLVWNDTSWGLLNVSPIAQYLNGGGTYSPIFPGDLIAQGQGFFVQVTHPTNHLTIPREARTLPIQQVEKNQPSGSDWMVIRVSTPSNGSYCEVRIGPQTATNDGPGALFMQGMNGTPALFAGETPGSRYAVRRTPTPCNGNFISLGFHKGIANLYSLQFEHISAFFPEGSFFLEDLQTGSMVLMTGTSPYEFSATVTDNPNRFRLFPSQVITGQYARTVWEPQVEIQGKALWIFSSLPLNQLEVFALTGQRILQRDIRGGTTTTFPLNLSPGCYILSLHAGNRVSNHKLIQP